MAKEQKEIVKETVQNGHLPEFLQDWLTSDEKAKVGERTKEIHAEAQQVRSDFLGELWESFLARTFPTVSKALDFMGMVGAKKKDPEVVAWQNEFEGLTSLTLLIPDSLLQKLTDHLANSRVFLTMVGFVHEDLANNIERKKNPDDVISAVRELHQYFVTGKVGYSKVQRKAA